MITFSALVVCYYCETNWGASAPQKRSQGKKKKKTATTTKINGYVFESERKMEGGNEKRRKSFSASYFFSNIFTLSPYVYHTNSQEYRHRMCIFSRSFVYIMPDYILENNIEKLMITQYEGGGGSSSRLEGGK